MGRKGRPSNKRKSKGLGDTVEKLLKPIAKALKLENCSPCKRRKNRLNKAFPYR